MRVPQCSVLFARELKRATFRSSRLSFLVTEKRRRSTIRRDTYLLSVSLFIMASRNSEREYCCGEKVEAKESREKESQEEESGEKESREELQDSQVRPFPAILNPAPSWSGIAVVNLKLQDISLKDYKGQYLILFFYPYDFTFVCPTEMIQFNDRYEEFKNIGIPLPLCVTD